MTLDELFGNEVIAGSVRTRAWQPDRLVTSLATDSRHVTPGGVFFARPGLRTHGARYVQAALAGGAVAIVAALEDQERLAIGLGDAPVMWVSDLQGCIGEAAHRFFGRPSERMRVVGVTGTNGKSSVVHFAATVLGRAGRPSATLGTLGARRYPEPASLSANLSSGEAAGMLRTGGAEPTLTTPDVIALHRRLASLADDGAEAVFLEASSHGLEQGRLKGLRLSVAALTNLSRDHFDYHRCEAAYRKAKRRLFEEGGETPAVVNAGDAFGASLLASLPPARAFGYLLEGGGLPAARRPRGRFAIGRILESGPRGMRLEVREGRDSGVRCTRLLGRFNAANALCAFGIARVLGLDFDSALDGLEAMESPPGRMSRVEIPELDARATGTARGLPEVIVDYAHTPEALRTVLRTLRPLARGVLWCVFGCGGERDRGKRSEMGAAARDEADRVVVTSDNPRSEVPGQIIEDILEAWSHSGKQPERRSGGDFRKRFGGGVRGRNRPESRAVGSPGRAGTPGSRPPLVIEARGEAIRFAISRAGEGDVVLIAGKGHESYQLVGSSVLPFDDHRVAQREMEARVRCSG